MRSKLSILACSIAVCTVCAIPLPLSAQNRQVEQHRPARYSIKVLETLGGIFGEAWGVNNEDLIVGHSTIKSEQAFHAFLWHKGAVVDLGTLGGPNSSQSFNKPLNDKGAVSGFSDTSTPDPNGEDFCNFGTNLICFPFVWQKGIMKVLPLLGGNNGQAGGLNNRGQIVGVSETPNSDPCSFAFLQVEAAIWENDTVQELPPFPSDAIGSAFAINDSGKAVGATGCITTTVRAVLWPNGPNGGVIDLGNLGGAAFNVAFDINNRDQVVGQSNLPDDVLHHGFLWENGIMTDLGSLPGLPTSLANAINNQGQVVGFSQDANGDDASSVAWIWQNSEMRDLNTLIPRGSALHLKEALSINDRGEIAGYGILSNGEHRPFLLIPCTENCGEDKSGRRMHFGKDR